MSTPVCSCACVFLFECVASGSEAGRPETEAVTREERIGVWKGVKALERTILAGMLLCPLLASGGLADFFFFLFLGD